MTEGKQKRSVKKGLVSDAVIYGFTRYLSIIAAIFLTPIYTRLLTKTEYGVQDVLVKWMDFSLVFVPLGLYAAIQKHYPTARESEEDRNELLGSTFITIVASAATYALLMQLLRPVFIETIIGLHQPFVLETFTLFNIMLFTRPIVDYMLQLSRVQFKALQYAAIAFSSFIFLSGLGFTLVYYHGWGVKGFFMAGICGNISAIAVGAYLNRKYLSLRFNKAKAVEYIRYSLPFVITGLMMQLGEVIGRWQIKHTYTETGNSMAMVGIYSIGSRISGILNLLITIFQIAWTPYLFNVAKQQNAKAVYANMLKLFLLAFGTLAFAIVLFRYELLAFFAPAYKSTYHQIFILVLAIFVKSIQYITSVGLIIDKRSKHIAYAVFPTVLTNVAVGAVLVRLIGLEGIAIGSLCGSVVWISYITYHSQRQYRVAYSMRFVWSFAFVFMAMLIGAYGFDQLFPTITFLSFTLKSIWLLLCMAGAFYYIRKQVWLGHIQV